MATAVLPLIMAVAGALTYALAGNTKLAEMGRILFFAGVFWLTAMFAQQRLHF